MMTNNFKAIFMAAGSLLLMLCPMSCNNNSGKTKTEKIAYLFDQAVEDHEFIGNAIVMEKGNTIYKKSFGNAKSGIPNSERTKFLIASLSKPFTAIIILKLIEQGKINVTDGVEKFFPEVPVLKGKKISVHHLLTHTSGMKEFITEKHVLEYKDLNDIVFNFEAGTDFEYSNSGYVLLKEIAEVSSGKTYEQLVSELIFNPLNMTSSGVARDVTGVPNLAIGYKDATQQEAEQISYSLEIIDGAGSLFSTANDMIKFAQGIYSEKFLSRSLRELMFHPHVREKFGYGWYLRERSGIWDVSYHRGDLPGYTSFLSIRKTNNQIILLLANAGGLDLADLENDIAKVLKIQN